MDVWEKKAAKLINKARSLVREEDDRICRDLPPSAGRDFRRAELQEILEQLDQTKAWVDAHDEVEWEYQTPLPF